MFSELKKLSKHTLIYGIGMVLGKAVGFFLIPFYTHYLLPEEYGILELIDTTGFILGYVVVLGIDEAIQKHYNITNDEEEKNRIVSTSLIFIIVIALLIFLILFPFRDKFSIYILGSVNYSYLFLILFLNICFGSSFALTKAIIRAQQNSVFFVAISLSAILLQVCLNIYFIAILKIGIVGILYSTLISSVLFGGILVLYIFKQTGFVFDIIKLIEMLKYGIPFVPAGIMAFVLNWSDRYFLRIYSDMEAIGLYSLGYKLGMIISFLIAMPFSFIWNAYIFEIQNKENPKEIYSRFSTYYMLLLCSTGLVISTFSKEIVLILADSSYLNAYKVIPIIILSMIFMNANVVLKVGLLVRDKTIFLTIANSIAAAINIPLNILLIPRFGIIGAAYATAISFFIYILAIYFASQRHYYISFEYIRIAKIFIAAIIVYILSSLIITNELWVTFGIKLAVLLCFPIVLFLTQFFFDDEKAFIKKRSKLVYQSILQTNK